jgi:hypothetical protein
MVMAIGSADNDIIDRTDIAEFYYDESSPGFAGVAVGV